MAFPWTARKHFIICRVLNVTQKDGEKEERVQLRKGVQTKIQAETTAKECLLVAMMGYERQNMFC